MSVFGLVVAWSGFSGWQTAQATQASRVILQNSLAFKTGLDYFFNDYERLPKTAEFESEIFMQNYFSLFPPKVFKGNNCEKTFAYSRVELTQAVIDFCLLTGVENYQSGWNKLIISK